MTSTRCRRVLLVTTAILGFNAIGAPVALAQADQTYQFDIPAEPLGQALTDFSAVSSKQIIMSEDAAKGRTTKGLHGRYTAEQALDALLAGTDLKVEVNASGVLMVRPKKNQAASNEAAPASTELIETVIVTGTNIRGEAPVGSPLTVYDRTALDRTGAVTVDQFLRTVPQNVANVDSSTQLSIEGNFNNSRGTAVDLRGLGAGSTLVLLDGHRLAPAGEYGAFADVSLIPLSAIDHIDVLTDGASSIYGADAVAGVMNFVLKKDYDGAEASALYGNTTDGGGEQTSVSALAGHSWSSGNVMITGEWTRQSAIFADQRDFIPPQAVSFAIVPDTLRQSAFISGHQDLAPGVELSVDGLFSTRSFVQDNAFFGTLIHSAGRATQQGANAELSFPIVGDWTGTVSGTYGANREIDKDTFTAFGNFTRVSSDSSSIATGTAKASGSLWDLPGGSMKGALGVEFRDEQFSDFTPGGAGSGLDRSVFSAFAELSVPIVGPDNARPWIEALDLSVSARYDHYSDLAASTNPKVGIAWKPQDDLTIRGSYATSYRVPPLAQLSNFGEQYFTALVPDPSSPSGTTDTLILSAIGNSALRPEKSRSFTAGVDWRPHNVPGLSLSSTFFDIDYKNRIASPPLIGTTDNIFLQTATLAPYITRNPTLAQVQQLFALPAGGVDGAGLGAAGVQAIFDDRLTNVATSQTDGVDFTGSYDFSTRYGDLTAFLSAAWLDKLTYQSASNLPPIETAGTVFNPPHWKMRGGFDWVSGPWSGVFAINFVGAHQNNLLTPVGSVSSWTTEDLQLAYAVPSGGVSWLTSGLKLTLNVQNITDTDPPRVPSGGALFIDFGYDVANATAVGRMISFQVTKSL
ncbi:MAG TPA: TonB-dependent receptor [Rhizomicrobium sp.]|jgi:outer membrane receptor protein involved in Fe transport|nr:TonB-dependent receptor [Rhizomicrobium sp.]